MRARAVTLLLAVAAATGLGVVSAPAASACAGEECPLICRVFDEVLHRPVCRINGAEVIKLGG